MLLGGYEEAFLESSPTTHTLFIQLSSLAASIVDLKWEENKSGFTVINTPLPFGETEEV
jgi:hypothetical protein